MVWFPCGLQTCWSRVSEEAEDKQRVELLHGRRESQRKESGELKPEIYTQADAFWRIATNYRSSKENWNPGRDGALYQHWNQRSKFYNMHQLPNRRSRYTSRPLQSILHDAFRNHQERGWERRSHTSSDWNHTTLGSQASLSSRCFSTYQDQLRGWGTWSLQACVQQWSLVVQQQGSDVQILCIKADTKNCGQYFSNTKQVDSGRIEQGSYGFRTEHRGEECDIWRHATDWLRNCSSFSHILKPDWGQNFRFDSIWRCSTSSKSHRSWHISSISAIWPSCVSGSSDQEDIKVHQGNPNGYHFRKQTSSQTPSSPTWNRHHFQPPTIWNLRCEISISDPHIKREKQQHFRRPTGNNLPKLRWAPDTPELHHRREEVWALAITMFVVQYHFDK